MSDDEDEEGGDEIVEELEQYPEPDQEYDDDTPTHLKDDTNQYLNWESLGIEGITPDEISKSTESFEFQVIDMEVQAGRCIDHLDDHTIKPDLLSDDARRLERMDPVKKDHQSFIFHDFIKGEGQYTKRKKLNINRTVPIFTLYGRERTCGISVKVNVFGFYPTIHVLTSISPTDQIIQEVLDFIRLTLYENDKSKKRPDSYDPVIKYRVVDAFPGTPYTPVVSKFIEITLAYKEYVNQSIMAIEKKKIIETNTGLSFDIMGYSNMDALSQFQIQTGIHNFYWVKVLKSELCDPKGYISKEVNVSWPAKDIIPIKGDDSIGILRVICFDIECLKSHGLPNPEIDALILICGQCSTLEQGCEVEQKTINFVLQLNKADPLIKPRPEKDIHLCFNNEEDLLEAFSDLLKTFDPDFLVGHNHVNFDIPFITTRANQLGSSARFMGRRNSYRWFPSRKIVRKRKSGDTRESFKTDTPGRIQVDTMLYIQGETRESSYKLNSLAQKYLGKGKDDVGYNMIAPLHGTSDKTRSRLAHYCLQDSTLTWGLCTFKRFNMILSVIQFCMATLSLGSHYFGGIQEKIWMLIYSRAMNPGFDDKNTQVLFPYVKPQGRSKDDKYEGATVLAPKRGYYNRERMKCSWVCVADFASLYPSIMISKNLCFSTQLRGTRYDDRAHCVTPKGAKFVTKDVRKGIIPQILEDVLMCRSSAKKMMAEAKKAGNPLKVVLFDGRQLALKKVANSVYGVTGASEGKLVIIEIAESVTLTGREMIAASVRVAEAEPYNARVIYGDTDSIMFYFPGKVEQTEDEAFKLLDGVCAQVSAMFPKPVALQAEKLYRNQILINKKRYVGELHARGEKPKIDHKGMESARRDTCAYLRTTLGLLYDALVTKGDVNMAVDIIKKAVYDLMTGKVPITELVITKSISKLDYKNPQVHINVSHKMKIRDPSYSADLGERIPYVIISNGAEKIYDKGEDPMWAITNNCSIDYKYYLDKQLSPAISRIMSWVVGKPDLINDVVRTEEAYLKSGFIEDYKKKLKKSLKNLQDNTTVTLFGVKALSIVPRIGSQIAKGSIGSFFEVKRLCPACKKNSSVDVYCKMCVESGEDVQYESMLIGYNAKLMIEEKSLRQKCAECRGYDTEDVKCVQRDCPTLYQRAAIISKMKGVMEKKIDLMF